MEVHSSVDSVLAVVKEQRDAAMDEAARWKAAYTELCLQFRSHLQGCSEQARRP